uniref:Golgi SNAP receptor complex member 1 n=1 Tax=Trieres chinensis TaxID=1514140 RepID=A0A7S1ZHV2_TRICV|mmetsp:Transcript_25636/g.52487  ORF Transcript_25636/g.52487 Transcript_25636/m.52487 type:complete len:248 (+) Transcript_25636:59-802(+)|eukprot:CAMPEP_0183293656 /NCGR_PEP_ID=MMETSP0160_2-20130417/2263_1 /TAXON_ID=2839 ORGANISM="Odontella Sinensis, Strain Grunow 1884" /NCGR_SAMPLE_ID=MMETSP0160_2 /ASSEMBLY_ACC=CAM_ASM_000250 /LENGTH=247 /DNA_ID=CAMNT_0025454809 /DNA_START=58 /DNA_END=801 /DNA_ORIENTATION=+
MASIPPADAAADFDALRREATKLERQLEERVARYQQVAQRLTKGGASNHGLESAEAGTAGGGTSVDDEEESALAADVSRVASTMTDLVERRLAPAAERTGKSQHTILVRRFREVLFDSKADFKKASASVARRREAMELFHGAGMAGSNSGGNDDPAMEHLLRERNAIGNSLNAADSVLGQAEEIRSDLRSQGASLRGIQGTMLNIAGNVPGLNGLIDSIRKKRNQDDMVVSGVIAFCILFTIWYIFG